jgi:hypothetical protein
MDTLRPPSIKYINKKQHIHYHKPSRCALTNSSLDCHFLLRVFAAVVVPAITASVHFAVDKLGEIDDEALVLARSKPEVEKPLDVDRFHEHLHVCAKQCRYVISSSCARRNG